MRERGRPQRPASPAGTADEVRREARACRAPAREGSATSLRWATPGPRACSATPARPAREAAEVAAPTRAIARHASHVRGSERRRGRRRGRLRRSGGTPGPVGREQHRHPRARRDADAQHRAITTHDGGAGGTGGDGQTSAGGWGGSAGGAGACAGGDGGRVAPAGPAAAAPAGTRSPSRSRTATLPDLRAPRSRSATRSRWARRGRGHDDANQGRRTGWPARRSTSPTRRARRRA